MRHALALGCLLLAALPAHAHRLEADYRVLPGRRVEIESWFDLSGESPKGATVQVFRKNGELLVEGKLNERGLYTFSCRAAEPLRVVVVAGAGHRKEFEIAEADLARVASEDAPKKAASNPGVNLPAGPPPGSAEEPAPFADRRSRISAKDVLVGVGFLLAAAAFVLSVRNARALRDLRRNHKA